MRSLQKAFRPRKARLLLLPALLAAGVPLHARAPGEAGFSFLKISPFARSAAMAEATSAIVGESLAVHSNPAGLAHLSSIEISGQHVSQLEDVTYNNVSFISPYQRGGWGINVGALSVDGISRTAYDGGSSDRFRETGEIDAGNLVAAFSVGRRQTESLALGATLKYVSEELDTESAGTAAADLGVVYRFNRRWRGAVVAQNLGPSAKFVTQKVSLPTRARAGAMWSPERWMRWTGEYVHNVEGDSELLFGGELDWDQTAYFRLGYRYPFRTFDLDPTTGLTFGVGLQLGSARADYAFLPFGDLGDSHRFSLTWRFSARREFVPARR